MADSLTAILEATLSPDTKAIAEAQQALERAAAEDLGQFLSILAAVLADVSKSQTARGAAGLQLKNYLTSKDSELKQQYQTRWMTFDATLRDHIKTLVLSALGTEVHQVRAAAQCVAYLAAVELPCGTWPQLITVLLNNVTSAQSTEQLKQASLDAIGYICEELDPKFLANQSNEILTAIVQGMRTEDSNNSVRLAATKALLNSLEFTKANFEKESERHFIMQVVCEATQCNSEEVQIAALQNLVKIMSLYYVHMEAYMGPALFAITMEAMKSSKEKVALQGIEFWSTVCDEEADLAIELTEAEETGRPPHQISRFYVKGAMPYLIPILLETMTMQDELDDEDDWNPCKAAGVCLSLMAGCCEDAIIVAVTPFVLENIVSDDWKRRDAAIMALGSIMEGPEPEELQKHITMLIEPLIMLVANDPMVQVKDSAAWTLGRVCERCPAVVLAETILPSLLQALVYSLNGEPRVAVNTCWALSSLAEAAYDAAIDEMADAEEDPASFCLSSSFEVMVSKVLETADRSDSGNNNLRSSAYEALMDLIKYSAKDCYSVVASTLVVVLSKFDHLLSLSNTVSVSDRQQLSDLCSLLCATLQALLRKLTKEDVQRISDKVMGYMLGMCRTLNIGQGSAGAGGVQEDAIITIGVLADVIGEDFQQYMNDLKPILLASIQNIAEVEVCLAGVNLVGDLCRNLLADGIVPHCHDIMQTMFNVLSHPSAHRSLKPPILSATGDIALALGRNFTQYLTDVFSVLAQAAQFQVEKDNFDMIDYCNELRDGCLDAFTGIMQGLKSADNQFPVDLTQMFQEPVMVMVKLIVEISKDEDKSETNISNALGLLGDLCTCFGAALQPVLQPSEHVLSKLVTEGKRSKVKRTKTMAQWASKELKSVLLNSSK